jgi:TatD DNase family protein
VLIDSHCHLDATYFPAGADEPLARAQSAGVSGFVVIGVGETTAQAKAAVELAHLRPREVAAVVGVHPHDASGVVEGGSAVFAEIAALAADPAVVAVGEIGLDYHYDHSPRAVQREVFARFIALAREVGKPMVIHTREAAADTLELLASEGARDVGGVIHCFSEDRAFAEKALELGFDLSFSGIVTFKSARAVQEVAAWAPLERLLVETDSPYLAPIPLRGKPCEPAYVVHTARHVAALRGIDLPTLAAATHANTERLFRRTFPV